MNQALTLPITALAFLLGTCVPLFIAELPVLAWIYPAVILAGAGLCFTSSKLFKICCIAMLGFGCMVYHVQQQLANSLPASLEAKHVAITGTIVSLVEYGLENQAKFLFRLDNQLTVQLTWSAPSAQLKPGDKWLLPVKLKRPRNYANPGSFDSEKHHFQNRIVATGYVSKKSKPQLLSSSWWLQPINRVRQQILAVITSNLAERKFSGVILALVLGTKSKLPAAQWEVFQNTGIAHLMSISGLHIGLIASLCFALLRICWRFAPVAWLSVPAPWVAAIGSLLVSSWYALLAGFAISTQRALIMLTLFLIGILFRRKVSPIQSYSLALLIILISDPLAVLSIGFWLSFVAVGLLLYALRGRSYIRWLRPQLVMALGLLPISLLFFARSSLISPLTNLIAIPWVSLSVVPLALVAMLLLPLNQSLALKLLALAETNFSLLWPLLEQFNQVPVYSWQTPTNYGAFSCALVAVLWFFVPSGLPGRYWALLGLMPLFFARATVIPYGQAQFTLLDVGQGLSAVVRTQNHVLVYDTGAKLGANFDLGAKVVVPYLQTQGIKAIDTLLISHADNDHIGGAESLIAKIPTKEILINDLAYLYKHDPKLCVAGRQWFWDGVSFEILHPGYSKITSKRNDHSCVLMIQAGVHKLLLTGDIETKAERHLVAMYGKRLQADLLLVPHHGSKTSSSLEFLQYVQPKYALIPVGYKNQYGHPKAEILARYQQLNIAILRSELDGAIDFSLNATASHALKPTCHRRQRLKFWLAKGS